MDKKQLTRTCLACGLEKPLAAFLQITGAQGTIYGNICATCRSTGAKGKSILPKTETDEGGSGSTRLKIDAQAKMRIDFQRKLQEDELKELTQEEKQEKEKNIFEKTERKETKEKAEKDHRLGYIEAKKKQGFLRQPQEKKTPSEKITPGSSQEFIEARKAEETAATEAEAKLLNTDVSQLYLDPQFGELKFQSEIFKRFKDWLGTSANFRVMEQLYQKKAEAIKKESPEKDPFTDYVEKSAKPSPSKKG